MTIRIANGAGFLGDDIDAPRRLVEAAEVEYLTLEYLAELTMSILARVRQKHPGAGYAGDFVDVAASLTPALRDQQQLRIVTNAGGVNPLGCVRQVARLLVQADLPDARVAVVTGDDLISRMDELRGQGCEFTNLDTGQSLAELNETIVAANAYLGAEPIAQSLAEDARIVITGRVADASLTVGPAVHAFKWAADDWKRLAAATVAGHLIECGAQVSGGYSQRWREHDLGDVGYPIAELNSSGEAVITKPAGTGGVVDRTSVVEQLVYEIGDPRCYVTPDVRADFTSVEVASAGRDRVRISGARGSAPPDDYKVSLAYQAGYTASGQILVYGTDCADKARHCGEIVRRRMLRAGMLPDAYQVEILGLGESVPGLPGTDGGGQPREVVARLAVRDRRREVVERFTKELAPLVTSGPAGLAGYVAGRPPVRPVFAYWPTLVPKSLVQPVTRVESARNWQAELERETTA